MIELFSDVQREKFYLRVALSSTNPCTRHAKRMGVKGGVSYEGSVMNVSNDGQPYAPIHVVNQLGSE